jgi:3',5'-cyclic AMP phosphodiesterase CpdA
MSELKLVLEKDGPIGWIIFNQPEKRNAVSQEMWQLMPDYIQELATDDAIRVVILRGAGERAFVAGADISQFKDRRRNAADEAEYSKISARGQESLTHLSKPSEFDTLQQVLTELSLPVFYVPGEHDVLEDDGQSYLQRFGKGTQGAGWYSFDQGGVHFIGLVNVVNLKAGGLGTLGTEQLEWLEKDVKRLTSSTPIVVFAHIPLWSVYPEWGWGTDDSARALSYLKRFGSVSVLNGHIHQVMQKVEGHITFHTAMSTAFPQPAPGSAPSPGPMKVEADRLKNVLGLTQVSFHGVNHPIAVTDVPLEGPVLASIDDRAVSAPIVVG